MFVIVDVDTGNIFTNSVVDTGDNLSQAASKTPVIRNLLFSPMSISVKKIHSGISRKAQKVYTKLF